MPGKWVKLKNGPMGPGQKFNASSSKSSGKRPSAVVSRSRVPVVKRFRSIAPRTGISNAMYTTFIYTSKGSINPPTLGAPAFAQYRLTSIFDPDLTGIGIQPIPYDQMAQLFERYLVYEAEYKVVMQNTSSTTDCIAWVTTCDDPATTTDGDRWIQQGQSEWMYVGARGTKNDQVEFHGTVYMPKAQGVSEQRYFSDDTFSAAFGSNPSDGTVLSVCAMDSSSGDPGALNFFIEIRYKTYLFGTTLAPAS